MMSGLNVFVFLWKIQLLKFVKIILTNLRRTYYLYHGKYHLRDFINYGVEFTRPDKAKSD